MTKQISVQKISLRNFKGIREFTMNVQGKNVRIFGDNAVGKTTLFDGFTWLLFDKDSQNKKDFQIKTLDKDGNELHGLEHEVEVVLMIDGKPVELRKVYKEKYTRKRGSATQEFTGHETDYYINGVPVKKGEYVNRVDEIVKEEVFKLLTSPSYFNDQLPWKKRREILLEVCGDVSDQDVILSNNVLSQLPQILNGRSIDDHRKVLVARRAEINKELDRIPVRIDEVDRSIPDTEGFDEVKIQRLMVDFQSRIEKKEDEFSRIQSGGEVAEKEKRLREIESEILQIKNQLQSDTLEKVSANQQYLIKVKGEHSDLQRKISDNRWSVDRNNKVIGDYKGQAERLRSEWHEVNNELFNELHDENCPTCGQMLPEDKIRETYEKAYAAFNLRKSKCLEDISAKGKGAKSESIRLEQENAVLSKEIEALEQKLATNQKEIDSLESKLNDLQSNVKDVESDSRYIQRRQEFESIQQEILQLKSSSNEAASTVREEIAKLKNQVQTLDQAKARLDQKKEAKERIEQLKHEEKTLAAEYERLEKELYLTEEFIKTKVNLLESKINSKFKYARYKLFEPQINGGLNEVCETLYEGVPYSGGLNNAARINVGLDIINTLSEHYGIIAPIFVDNAEAVTRLIETIGQTICLVVSEKDKQLRVENQTVEAV